MLGQRVVTALVLLLVVLPTLFYPSPEPFSALAIVFIAAAAWEWARLVGYMPAVSTAFGASCALSCLLAWGLGRSDEPLTALWWAMAMLWVGGGGWLLYGGVPAWQRIPRAVRLVAGLLILVAAWLALARARAVGINFLLSIMVLVWVADIAAYFSGRALGGQLVKRKLAPGISPGKTWEGVFGGMLGVAILALAWHWADTYSLVAVPSFFSVLLGGGAGPMMLLVVLWLAGMSVVGDLIESLVKRAASVKDSSALLPGHGGVLDRIDALLPTLPLAMLASRW